jgi:hypothetical protein
MIKLSVLVPGIRNSLWLNLYNSIEKAFSGEFEVIFVGPYDLPDNLQEKDNVSFFKCMRSPIASQQIALIESKFDLIVWASDDGEFLPGSLDTAVKYLENEPYTTIVTARYQEGNDLRNNMTEDWYYTLWNHETMQLPGVPKDCYMLNCGVVSRALLMELGGWDAAKFRVCPLAYTDFAIRAYKRGCKFILQPEVMFSCSHQPGETGDHGPIHRAQTEFDQPMFSGMYSVPSTYLTRQNIPVNNWERSEEVWGERFSK